ncbi:MAG: glycosyltransferase family 39 protein [Myxococcota bacterium]
MRSARDRRVTRLRASLPVIVLVVLVTVFAARLLDAAIQNALTIDEPHYMGTGVYLWQTGDYHFERILLYHPPLAHHLASLPLLLFDLDGLPASPAVAEALVARGSVDRTTLRIASRIPFILLSCWGAILLFFWAREVAGSASGLLAAFLASMSPALMAHGSLAHSDVAVGVLYFQTLYLFWRWSMQPTGLRVVLCGISLGLALLSKHSAILLLPTLALLLGWSVFLPRRPPEGDPRIGPETLGPRLLWAAGAGVTLLGLAVVVIWLGYGGSFAWTESPRWPGVQLPGWAQPFLVYLDARAAHRSGFLLGELAPNIYGWKFFPLAFAIKTPVGILLLLLLALVTLSRFPSPLGRFLGVPCLVLLGTLFFVINAPMGLRYMLPLDLLILLLIATQLGPRAGSWMRATVFGACLWTAGASLWIHPHHLAYFNELIGGPARGHHYVLDSNLDWGQDLSSLARYLQSRGNPPVSLAYFGAESPAVYGIRARQLEGCEPVGGIVAISVNVWKGLYASPSPLLAPVPGCYDWLRGHEPVARPGYSILVYELPERP